MTIDTDVTKKIKLVLVGEKSVGKTALISIYLKNKFHEDYRPTTYDEYHGIKTIEGKEIPIEIQDTSGEEQVMQDKRQGQYEDADIFIICVACNARDQLDSVGKWKADFQAVEPAKPIALILTKSDLAGECEEPITLEELREKSTHEGLQYAAETSSKQWDDHNVHKAFAKVFSLAYRSNYGDEEDSHSN